MVRIRPGEPPCASRRLPGVFADDVHPPLAEAPLLASTKGVAQLTKNEEDGPRQRSPSPGHVPRTPAAQAHAGHGLPEQRRQVARNSRRFGPVLPPPRLRWPSADRLQARYHHHLAGPCRGPAGQIGAGGKYAGGEAPSDRRTPRSIARRPLTRFAYLSIMPTLAAVSPHL